jgi:hypothetical protein
MAVLTVMPKQADLTEVMTLITAQLREVAKGITVMDFANATSAHIMSSADAVSVIGPDGKKENVPFKTTHPRVSGVQGDAVSQAVVASCRSQTSTQFCRCCFCNQGSVDKKTKVYDVRADLLLHNVGNVALTHTRSINHYRTDIDSRLADVGGYPFFFFFFFLARAPEQTRTIRKAVWDYWKAHEHKSKKDGRMSRSLADEVTKRLGVLLEIGSSVPGPDPFFPGMDVCLIDHLSE